MRWSRHVWSCSPVPSNPDAGTIREVGGRFMVGEEDLAPDSPSSGFPAGAERGYESVGPNTKLGSGRADR